MSASVCWMTAPVRLIRWAFCSPPTAAITPARWMYQAGLAVYDLLALQWSHQRYDAGDFQKLAPNISQEGLKGGFRYGDAQTYDARLCRASFS